MSTRCTTHFVQDGQTEAIIYRHCDGNPKYAGRNLIDFLFQCQKLKDTRLDDPSYLAARHVVHLG